MIKAIALSVALSATFCVSSYAAPPPPDSAQHDMLEPYSDWIRGLHNPNTHIPCCSAQDCRAVEWRIKDGHYEVFIDSDTYTGGPNKWMVVPDNIVMHVDNPIGQGLACWSSNRMNIGLDSEFYCFAPGGGT